MPLSLYLAANDRFSSPSTFGSQALPPHRVAATRFLATAFLLTLLTLATFSRPVACQETTASPPAPLSTANATNATEWIMPPEVEALFPKDAVFDNDLWYRIAHPHHLSTERFKIKFVRGARHGVCNDYEININLWGGCFEFGASMFPIHPNHPHKDRFRTVEWEKLDPRQHINIIRDMINREWRRMNTKLSNENPGYKWKKMAPIIKRILFGQNDGVYFYLGRASLDVASTGESQVVYRYSFFPVQSGLDVKGKLVPTWFYYFADNSNFIEGQDATINIHEPFFYMNKLYFVDEFGMSIRNGLKYNGKVSFSTHCEFEILK